VLRDEWGFEGFVISDWIFGLRDAGASLAAGLDVEMPYRMIRAPRLPGALEAGEASWADVDRSVTAVVSTLLRFAPVLSAPRPEPAVLAADAHRALAREAAAKSVVVLRNEPVDGAAVLPLQAAALERLAVVGRLAAVRNLGDGGSSDVWAPDVVTPLQGLRAALPTAEVVHDTGADPDGAAALAAGCDAAVVVVGYTREDEGEFIGAEGTAHLGDLFPGPDDPDLARRFTEGVAADPGPEPPAGVEVAAAGGFATGGDRTSLRLHPADEALVATVAAANARTVVAIVAGSAVVIEPWAAAVPAVVQAWYSGMEGGHALADVLLGAVNPSGRLPFTVPTDAGHLPPFDRDADRALYDEWHGWWLLERDGHAAAYPFGFGLSYTTFALASAHVERAGDGLTVTAAVANTGGRAGADVVQVYARRHGWRPRLVGFRRVEVDPGTTAEVTIPVPLERLAGRVGPGEWVVEPGTYELAVARHAADPDAHRLDVRLP
jgi:hypothetical protein